MNILKISAGLALLLAAGNVSANSMRCGSHTIQDSGEDPPSMQEVIAKCGAPSSRQHGELIYAKKGKRLVFDSNGKLMTIHEDSEPRDL